MKLTVKQLRRLVNEAFYTSDTSDESLFKKGDVVTVDRPLQGLNPDERYEVVGSETEHTPFGGFTTYIVKPEGSSGNSMAMAIRNGHMVLKKVNEEAELELT